LVGENPEGVRLTEWRLAVEAKGLRINRSETEYIEYVFGGRDLEVYGTWRAVKISGDVIGEIENSKYFGSFVHEETDALW